MRLPLPMLSVALALFAVAAGDEKSGSPSADTVTLTVELGGKHISTLGCWDPNGYPFSLRSEAQVSQETLKKIADGKGEEFLKELFKDKKVHDEKWKNDSAITSITGKLERKGDKLTGEVKVVWYNGKLFAEGAIKGKIAEKDGKIESIELEGDGTKFICKGEWKRQGKTIPLEGPATIAIKVKK